MKYCYWLFQVPGMTSAKISLLYRRFSCAKEIFFASENELRQIAGLNETEIQKLVAAQKEELVEEHWLKLQMSDLHFTCIEASDYPEKIKLITDPPYGLLYRGYLPNHNKRTVAIVGSRKRSAYGEQVARMLSEKLAMAGVEIISGMALGIDADAHKGAIQGKGRTYAVLAGGADVCYPATNRYLYDAILCNGGIISEYPMGTQPLPFMFPMRNRIISALSDCVIVIEAREKSGSLITADYALEQGKDIYAVPGRINDGLSRGCNLLIKQGAGIIYDVEDFIKEWLCIEKTQACQMDFKKNVLEKEELLVYSLLDFCPVGMGTLMNQTSYGFAQMIAVLEHLVQLGYIKETIPGYYVRTL